MEIGGLKSDDSLEFNSRNPWLTTVTLSDGTIVAKDLTRLMYFSKDGRLLRSSGQKGRGPGEFQQTREICLVNNDRVPVIDVIERVSVWDAHGELIRSTGRLGSIPNGGCTPEGNVVVRTDVSLNPGTDTLDNLVPHRIANLDGVTVSNIGMFPGEASGALSFMTPSIVVSTDAIHAGNGRSYEIRSFNRSGTLTRISRLGRQLPDISDLEWKKRTERAQDLYSLTHPTGALRQSTKPLRDPAFSQIRIDPANRLWVADYKSEQNWTVFDHNGKMLGRVHLSGSPRSMTALAGFGPDYVVIRYRDDTGALHLSFHRTSASVR